VPAAQSKQLVLPWDAANVPPAQAVQEEAPETAEAVPAAQGSHAVAFNVALKKPGEHARQLPPERTVPG